MNGSFETCLSCSLILAAVAFALCQGHEELRTCSSNSTPHDRGYCGERLTIAHENLCFLLRRVYPRFFNKRSSSPSLSSPSSSSESLSSSYFASQLGGKNAPGRGRSRVRRQEDMDLLERIYSIPISVLARLKINEDNWRSFIYNIGDESQIEPREATDEFRYAAKDQQELPVGPTKRLIRMLSKRSNPDTEKRSWGLSCDCCYNQCSVETMATYC